MCSRSPASIRTRRSVPLIDAARASRAGPFAGSHVSARVEHHRVNAQRLGALELDDHRVDRLVPEHVVRSPEVDEVRGVRDDRLDARRLPGGAERGDGRVRERLCPPLIRVLREDRDRRGADVPGALERGLDTPRRRDVGA